VTWVESHDTFGNYGETADLTARQIIYGWAVIGSREGSTPLFFNRPMNSNPPGRVEKWGDNIAGARGNNDFFAPEVVAVNHFKNAMRGSAEYLSNPLGRTDLLMVERGGSGAVIVNMGSEAVFDGIPVRLVADGTYTDAVSGGIFAVNNGRLYGVVPDGAIVVFHNVIDNPIPANITEPIPAPQVTLVEDGTITLHVRVPTAWKPSAVWAWNYGMAPTASNAFDAWPGEFFAHSENEWYIVELPAWVNNIIINGRNGSVQTAGLSTVPNRDIWITVNEAGVATLSNVPIN
jgi:alpha-amylase